jgi:hypothetical protein
MFIGFDEKPQKKKKKFEILKEKAARQNTHFKTI